MSYSMKDFLNKFFDLCREYQQEIPPQKMAEILREYADRLNGIMDNSRPEKVLREYNF